MKEVRIHWLNELLETRFGGSRKQFQEAADLTKGRVSQMLGSGFSDTSVANVLKALSDHGIQLPPDYFDRPIPKADGPTPATVTTLTPRALAAVEAFEIFAAAVNAMPPKKRDRVMESAKAYAADLTDENERDYVVRALSGELPAKAVRRKRVGER